MALADNLIFVSKERLNQIIETREPKGLFYYDDGEIVIGVDNRTGDAWTKNFDSISDCIKWLS